MQVAGADACVHCGEPVRAELRKGESHSAGAILAGIGVCIGLLLVVFVPYVAEADAIAPWSPLVALALVGAATVLGRERSDSGLRVAGGYRVWLVALGLALPFGVAESWLWEAAQGTDPVWPVSVFGGVAATVAGLGALVVAEELALRGLVFGLLRPMMSATGVVTLTTVTFALARVPWPDVLMAIPLGIALGVLRERSGSPYPGMALRLMTLAALGVSHASL